MDSFELNKILGAILATCLVVLVTSFAAGAIFTPVMPEKPGYEIAVKEDTHGGGKDAAPASAELVVDPKAVPTATVHADNNSTPQNSASKNSTPKTTPKTALRTAASGMRAAHVRTAERSVPHKPHALVALHGLAVDHDNGGAEIGGDLHASRMHGFIDRK